MPHSTRPVGLPQKFCRQVGQVNLTRLLLLTLPDGGAIRPGGNKSIWFSSSSSGSISASSSSSPGSGRGFGNVKGDTGSTTGKRSSQLNVNSLVSSCEHATSN